MVKSQNSLVHVHKIRFYMYSQTSLIHPIGPRTILGGLEDSWINQKWLYNN